MINVKFDSTKFAKDLNNVTQYAAGFIEGAQKGKTELLNYLGTEVIEELKEFVDANARLNPSAMHHVYEWYRTGSPESRLFDITYITNQFGLSFNSSFSQSVSVKNGSKFPFYDKARIMEDGIPVVIKPVASEVLVFEENGEQVFTKKPVSVNEPGGGSVQGSYKRVFEQFFNTYFSQSFLKSSGILSHLENAEAFKKNISRGQKGGKGVGLEVGYRWISRRPV